MKNYIYNRIIFIFLFSIYGCTERDVEDNPIEQYYHSINNYSDGREYINGRVKSVTIINYYKPIEEFGKVSMGDPNNGEEIIFSKNGIIADQNTFGFKQPGGVKYYQKRKYDNYGNLEEISFTDKGRNNDFIYENEMIDGLLTETKVYKILNEGDRILTEINKYNDSGKLIEEIRFGVNGEISRKDTYKYDDYGFESEHTIVDANWNGQKMIRDKNREFVKMVNSPLKESHIWRNDSLGNTLEYIRKYDKGRSVDQSNEIYQYNDLGKLESIQEKNKEIRDDFWIEESTSVQEFKYDQYRNKVESMTTKKSWTMHPDTKEVFSERINKKKQTWKYDSKGNEIESVIYTDDLISQAWKDVTEYDDNGNWILRKSYGLNGENTFPVIRSVKERKFEYFE